MRAGGGNGGEACLNVCPQKVLFERNSGHIRLGRPDLTGRGIHLSNNEIYTLFPASLCMDADRVKSLLNRLAAEGKCILFLD